MNTRSILTLSTALVLGGTLMTASAFARAEEKNMGDSWITAKTKIALFADSRVKGSDINVATTDGAVITIAFSRRPPSSSRRSKSRPRSSTSRNSKGSDLRPRRCCAGRR